MTSEVLPKDPRIASWESVAVQADQSTPVYNDKPRAPTANMELYPRKWYIKRVGRGPKRPTISMNTLWEGIGLVQESEERKAMREKANSLVDREILRLDLKDKKQHPEIEAAVKTMDRTYRDDILRERQYCTRSFRECLWYKLILSRRYNQRKSAKDNSDATYVDEDLDTETAIDSAAQAPNIPLRESIRRSNANQDVHQPVGRAPQTTRDVDGWLFRSATPEYLDEVNPTQLQKDVRSNLTEKDNAIDRLSETTEGGNLDARSTRSTPKNTSNDRTTLPRLSTPKSNGPRAAIRQGTSILGATSGKDPVNRLFKRPFQEDKPVEGPKRQRTTPSSAKSPSKNNPASSTVPISNNYIEIDSDSELPDIRPFLQDLDDIPLVSRPKSSKPAESPAKRDKEETSEELSKSSPGLVTPIHTSIDVSKTALSNDYPKQNETANPTRTGADISGANPSGIPSEGQDQRDAPTTPQARTISISDSPRLIPGFKLAKTQPHGKVRVGYIRDGQYSPIHTGKIGIKEIQEIFDVFRNSTGTILTEMQMWLRDTSYIDGLGIQSVTLPPEGPYPQLYKFFSQEALREQSKIGLDFVVEPVGLEDYFEW